MKKKILISVFLIILCAVSVFGLDFTTKITDVKMHPDFWGGVFPTSVSYAAGTEDIKIIPNRKTSLFLELGSGTLARTITRDPLTGVPLSFGESDYDYLVEHPDYDVMYASWSLEFSQGLLGRKDTDKDSLTISFAFDGRWEIAMNPILQTDSRSGYPLYYEPFSDDDFTTSHGTPELSGGETFEPKSLIYMNYRISGVLDDLLLMTGSRSGIKVQFQFIWAPEYLNLSRNDGGLSSYSKFWAYANGGSMLMKKEDEKGNNLASVGISYDVEVRYLDGEYIPKAAEALKGSIWFYEPESMTYLVRGTAKLDLYGPQFMGSCIPRVYGFLDFSNAWGKYNNCNELDYDNITTASYGVHLELKLFGALAFYYEIGEVFYYTGENPESFLGTKHSDGLKIAMELSI
ncbi:MAG: hypothetical protein K6F82_03405 [Sphaerochaetaceae bacterium]|nr:hypothetical protein [Sphaerochaetaceae bacterium]